MAGIVVGLGNTGGRLAEKIGDNFERCKGLKKSHMFSNDFCYAIKYGRNGEEADNNWFESNEVVVFAVGTVLYKTYAIENSLSEIGEAIALGVALKDIAEGMDGHFFVGVLSKRQCKGWFITDVGGTINTYILRTTSDILLSTSMLALAQCFSVSPDIEAIMTFVRSGMFFNDTTYFNEIKTLDCAHIYEYAANSEDLKTTCYWNVPKNVKSGASIEEASHGLKKALFEIMERIPPKKTVYDFTGGYDSRFVFCLAISKAIDLNKFYAFYFGPPESREAKIVENSCRKLGVNYVNYGFPKDWDSRFFDYVLLGNQLCDGLINSCEYAPVLWVQEMKRKSFECSVLGLFGEIYRGFTAKQEFLLTGKRRRANLERFIRFRNLAGSFNMQIFSDDVIRIVGETEARILKTYEKTNFFLDQDSPNTLQLDNVYFSHRMRRWGGRSVTTTNQIIRVICPLWFKKALNIAFSLDHRIKGQERLMRSIAENVAPDLAKEKTIAGSPFLPISTRNLVRFIPATVFYLKKAVRKFSEVSLKKNILGDLTMPGYRVVEWYQQALKDPRCADLLNWEGMISREFYDKRKFDEFVQDAKGERFRFYSELGNIITVELTLRYAKLKDVCFRQA
jgi:hypothetical protein